MKKQPDLTQTLTQRFALDIRTGGEVKDNTIAGVAAVTGVMNANRYVFYPGSFMAAIPSFLTRGFVSYSHDWDGAIAMPTMAAEVGKELVVEAEFHSDAKSQAVRVKCMERIAKGLFVGFSVGVSAKPGKWAYFETGETLWEHAMGYGVDMSQMDPALRQSEDVFAIFEADLVEWSIVMIPAEKTAGARLCASQGQTLEEEIDTALAAVSEIVTRATQINGMRTADGRTLSNARVEALVNVQSQLGELTAVLSAAPYDAQARAKYLTFRHRSLTAGKNNG